MAVESNPWLARQSISSICSDEVDRKTRICSFGTPRYIFSRPSTGCSEVSGSDFQRHVADWLPPYCNAIVNHMTLTSPSARPGTGGRHHLKAAQAAAKSSSLFGSAPD